MNVGRRVVLVVALAAALAVVAATASRILLDSSDGGWFMSTGNGDAIPMSGGHSDEDTVLAAAIWLAAVAVWFGVAWRLFRPRDA